MSADVIRIQTHLVAGERPDPAAYQFLQANKQPINLLNYQTVITIKERFGDPTSHAATVTDVVNGVVGYSWDGSEFPTAGTYWVQFWAGNGVNRYASPRAELTVEAPIGAVPAI